MKIDALKNTLADLQNREKRAKIAVNELIILREVDHPCIVKVLEAYRDNNNFALVTQLCKGHTLFQEVIGRKQLPEKEAINIFRQLLLALIYLHGRRITHRDIKAENVVIEQGRVKLIDFGLASQEHKLRQVAGTKVYMAPEILRQEAPYSTKADMWSLGILFYISLTGCLPYRNASDVIDPAPIRISKISAPAKDLLSSLLQPDEKLRITARDALSHSLFDQPVVRPENIAKYLKTRERGCGLQKICLMYLTHRQRHEDGEASEVFKYIDGLLQRKIENLSKSDKKLIVELNDNTDYTGLLINLWDSAQITDDQLRMAFQYFDHDQNGGISANDLRLSVGRDRTETSDHLWPQLINEVTTSPEISFSQFRATMTLQHKSDY